MMSAANVPAVGLWLGLENVVDWLEISVLVGTIRDGDAPTSCETQTEMSPGILKVSCCVTWPAAWMEFG